MECKWRNWFEAGFNEYMLDVFRHAWEQFLNNEIAAINTQIVFSSNQSCVFKFSTRKNKIKTIMHYMGRLLNVWSETMCWLHIRFTIALIHLNVFYCVEMRSAKCIWLRAFDIKIKSNKNSIFKICWCKANVRAISGAIPRRHDS